MASCLFVYKPYTSRSSTVPTTLGGIRRRLVERCLLLATIEMGTRDDEYDYLFKGKSSRRLPSPMSPMRAFERFPDPIGPPISVAVVLVCRTSPRADVNDGIVVTMTSEAMTHRRAERLLLPRYLAASTRRLPRRRFTAFAKRLFARCPPSSIFLFLRPRIPRFMHYVCNWASARVIHVCIEYRRCMIACPRYLLVRVYVYICMFESEYVHVSPPPTDTYEFFSILSFRKALRFRKSRKRGKKRRKIILNAIILSVLISWIYFFNLLLLISRG